MGALKNVIILHGWTTSTEKWSPFMEQLSKKGIMSKILPIPGLTEEITHPWILDDYITWLKKEIGTQKVILIGHSNGGRIAISFAAKYPNHVNSLILIDSAGIYHDELPIKIKRLVFGSIAKFGKKLTSSKFLRDLLYKVAKESDYKNATLIQRQTMINLISQDLTPILGNIKTPTLLIWGREDKITPLSDGQLIHKFILNSKLKIINGATHSPQFTHPQEVVKIIYEHL